MMHKSVRRFLILFKYSIGITKDQKRPNEDVNVGHTPGPRV